MWGYVTCYYSYVLSCSISTFSSIFGFEVCMGLKKQLKSLVHIETLTNHSQNAIAAMLRNPPPSPRAPSSFWDGTKCPSRRRVNMVGRNDSGDNIIAHEFNYSVPNQVVYDANGVRILSTPVEHYDTPGPVALRLEWNGLVFTYSGKSPGWAKQG